MKIIKYLIRSIRMKNERRKGKSARNGNAPSPYTKYNKAPYQYSYKSQKQSGPAFQRRPVDKRYEQHP